MSVEFIIICVAYYGVNMKKKICVIFTGGTIGSNTHGNRVSLSGESKKMLIEKYHDLVGHEVSFDELSPVNILSENVQPRDLNKLYSCVKGVDTDKYDGIIITHGTDTLCFTVNWFSQVFCQEEKPIVFVSALYPLTDPRSNGMDNFIGAVDFIESGAPGGVYCAFKNDGENCRIHLGSRLIYPEEISGFYRSALNAHFAEVVGGKVEYNVSPFIPTVEEVRNNRGVNCDPRISGGVMLITMRSLLNFAVYDFTDVRPKAVIVELSHSGTVCTKGDNGNFIKFAAYCKKCGVDVIIGPVMSRAGVYSSMKDLPAHVKMSYDLTIEMTLVKVMAAVGAGLPSDAYFKDNRAFELIPYPVK